MKGFTSARALALALVTASACDATTGSDHVRFVALASGPADPTSARQFTTNLGYAVTLTTARLHIGGLYLNQTVPLSGKQASGCYLPGVYVGQVLGGVDVDLLSPTPVAFPVEGDGLELAAHAAEVWLTGGPIDAAEDATVILALEGTAARDGAEWPFSAALTIGSNRLVPSTNPTTPNARPICLERVADVVALPDGTPIELTPHDGGTLRLTIDPRGLFVSVNFSALPEAPGASPHFRFRDAPDNPADITLYQNLHARSGVYAFEWQD